MNTKAMVMMLASALLVGCGAQDDGGGGDDGPGGDGGNGNDGSPGAYFVDSSIRDERGDAITFTAEGPVHAHVGEAITLGGSDCPTVYKHAYLLDQAGPRFGREQAPNPLAWKLELEAAAQLDLARSTYRVRTASDQVLLDWTSLPAPEENALTIALHRAGDVAIPALGEHAGELFLDVRTVDVDGGEKTVSACWDHQPLAAPLEIERPRPSASPGLITSTFTDAGGPSAVASVVNGSTTMRTLYTRITQYTTEPLQISIDVAAPTAAYTSRIVDDYVETARSSTSYYCGPDEIFETDPIPRCDVAPLADPADLARSGALTSTRWTATLVDATGVAVDTCTTSADLHMSCSIPARAADAPAHVYALIVSATSFEELFPPSTAIALHLLGTERYVGMPRAGTARCGRMRLRQEADGSFGKYCIDTIDYARIVALDRSTVTVDPVVVAVETAPTASLPLVPAATVSSDPLTWDVGDADLPGAQ